MIGREGRIQLKPISVAAGYAALSIATPDHWHALMTVLACQAGKDVYVEKPVSYCVDEGRGMVQAARKYGRMVQADLNMRSSPETRAAVQFLHAGGMGSIYRSKALILKGRAGIGHVSDFPVPEGVHWDLFLGPAPAGETAKSHFENFIDCVRSRKREELYCDIHEGHMSTTLCHLANISYRTGRKLVFDPKTERFVGDDQANSYLSRKYRAPFTFPEKI